MELICWVNQNTKQVYYRFSNYLSRDIGDTNSYGHEVIDIWVLNGRTFITKEHDHQLYLGRKRLRDSAISKREKKRNKLIAIIDILLK